MALHCEPRRHIGKCANVRIDGCTSDPVLIPSWSFLSLPGPLDCCGVFIGSDGADPPVGIGTDASGARRGAPFCRDDNLWASWDLLAPATYYYAVFSDADGSFAAPIVGGSGEHDYQLHITVAACPIAACCVNVCEPSY